MKRHFFVHEGEEKLSVCVKVVVTLSCLMPCLPSKGGRSPLNSSVQSHTQSAAPHLKTPHVPGVPCVLQAVLVTLQEELEEEPACVRRERKR